jgi:uncharacterized protein
MSRHPLAPVLSVAAAVLGVYGLLALGIAIGQRTFIYFPSHRSTGPEWTPWTAADGTLHGYARPGEQPRAVWLMLHGNAGQASDRGYAARLVDAADAFYVLEYPGYGQRPGKPSRTTIDRAAAEGYADLRRRHPGVPIKVLGESLGSGPASSLARQTVPPEAIVLVVPFDSFPRLAGQHMPFLPARWLLRDRWENAESLHGYRGALLVYGSQDDTTIPPEHARRLAAAVPHARLVLLPGGHNDWSSQPELRLKP